MEAKEAVLIFITRRACELLEGYTIILLIFIFTSQILYWVWGRKIISLARMYKNYCIIYLLFAILMIILMALDGLTSFNSIYTLFDDTKCSDSLFMTVLYAIPGAFGMVYTLLYAYYMGKRIYMIAKTSRLINSFMSRLVAPGEGQIRLQRVMVGDVHVGYDSFRLEDTIIEDQPPQAPQPIVNEVLQGGLRTRHVRPDEHLVKECVICLDDFNLGFNEQVCDLPACRHSYHVNCILEWLRNHSTCPTCRRPVEI